MEATTSWTVGSVRITKVPETVVPTPAAGLLPTAGPDVVARHQHLAPDFMDEDGTLHVSVHALVVESGDRRIVVDTCVGNGRSRPFPGWSDFHTDFLARLTAAGFPPGTLDTVVCTHLHFDHVGWNTTLVDGHWTPTFPNARYLFGEHEWHHWRTEPDDHAINAQCGFADSVEPVIAAGLVDFVPDGHRLTAEVVLEPTPGHTPGHQSVVIASGGERAVITGDVAHHPLQFLEPEIASAGDSDPDLAVATRRAFLARYGDGETLVIGTHFSGPTAGRVVPAGAGWRMESS
jgi:glyoxylase-like metal-dependent hydrolase (beta-lactamase superfamily II)